MPERFVLDSSALAKTFLDEAESAGFRRWLRDRLDAGEPLLSPTLVPYELGETVRQKKAGSPEDRARIVETASRIVQLVGHEALLAEAFRHTLKLSFYDSAFVALSRAVGATLVTFDGALARAARACGVAVLSPGSP
jgi:predicted nucleic acid-binding protein